MAMMYCDDDLDNMDTSALQAMSMILLNELEHAEAAKVVLTHLFLELTPVRWIK